MITEIWKKDKKKDPPSLKLWRDKETGFDTSEAK